MNNRDKRLALFRKGASALARVSECHGLYACPICARLFDEQAAESGQLTLEDVPPAAIGGRPLVLTCHSCNHGAGHLIDAQASNRQTLRHFIEAFVSTGTFVGRSKLSIPGVGEVNAVTQINEEGRSFVIPAERNPPGRVERFREGFRALLQDPSRGDLHVKSVDRFHDRLARLSDLKSGYLAAFATFGYTYAMSSHLALVRKQLLDPQEEILTGFWCHLPNGDSTPRYLLGVLREPAIALFARIGPYLVLLPTPQGPRDPYSEFSKRYAKGQKIEVRGVPLSWPQGLEMRWDLAS